MDRTRFVAKRYFSAKEFARVCQELGPGDRVREAREEVNRWEEICARVPQWSWPKVCHQFAQDALRLIENPERNPMEVLQICERFEQDGRGIKGIFGLQFLHDWLLDSIEENATH
jgi:hypothetical protein